jgi:hypothetical protein
VAQEKVAGSSPVGHAPHNQAVLRLNAVVGESSRECGSPRHVHPSAHFIHIPHIPQCTPYAARPSKPRRALQGQGYAEQGIRIYWSSPSGQFGE